MSTEPCYLAEQASRRDGRDPDRQGGERVSDSPHPATPSGRMPGGQGALQGSTKWRGLLRRQERWWPTRRGWFVLLTLSLGSAALLLFGVHPFLAVTDKVDAEYLVVEGWVPNYALQESITEFKSKPYQMLYTVGAEILTGVNVESGDTYATHAVTRLKWLGMDPQRMQAVSTQVQYRNRTYESALALRKWSAAHHVPVTRFNLVTLGPHARRSRLLFEKAFNGTAQVGIIAVEDREYDPVRWWKYSEGVKSVLSEGAAYLYVRLAFWP